MTNDKKLVQPVEAIFSADEIAGGMAAAKAPASSLSPLPAISKKAVKPKPLEKEWRDAFRTLNSADRVVRLVAIDADGPRVSFFYGSASEAGFAGIWPEGDGWRVGFPWSVDRIVEECTAPLLGVSGADGESEDVRLSLNAVITLAAAVDAVRMQGLTGLIARVREVDFVLDYETLHTQLIDGFTFGDSRWLVTQILQLMPPFEAAPVTNLDEGLGELRKAGLVEHSGDQYRPSPRLIELCGHWHLPLPSAALGCYRANGQPEYRAVIKGLGPLYRFDFGLHLADGRAPIALRRVKRAALFDLMKTAVAQPGPDRPVRRSRQSANAPAQGSCANCGAELKPGKKFCSRCGTLVVAPQS